MWVSRHQNKQTVHITFTFFKVSINGGKEKKFKCQIGKMLSFNLGGIHLEKTNIKKTLNVLYTGNFKNLKEIKYSIVK